MAGAQRTNWITATEVRQLAAAMGKSPYGEYLFRLAASCTP